MRTRRAITDFGFRALNAVHRMVLRVSRGRVGSRAFGMPVVILHAVGRRSKQHRDTVLTAPIVDANRVVLVASKGGDDRHPDWYRNVLAHPSVELSIAGQRRAMHARQADHVEREVLWPRVVAAYKGYERYQRRANREIPLVVLEPDG